MFFIRSCASSGFSISLILSEPTFASHNLKGSAFLEGIDWMILNIPSLFAQLIILFLPSFPKDSRGVQIVPQFPFNPESLCLIFLIYCLILVLSLRISIMSEIEKNHSLLCQVLRIFLFLNTIIFLSSSSIVVGVVASINIFLRILGW